MAGIDLNADLGEGFGIWNPVVSRREPGAVLHYPATIADRVVTMVTAGHVIAIDGARIAVSVESVCLHGDSPGAVQIATAVRDQLKAAGTDIRAFS